MLERYFDLGRTPVTPPSEVGHLDQLGGLPLRVGQVLVFLAIAALINAVVLTVRMGRREVAVHRVLGFTNAQVVGVHVWQGVVVAIGTITACLCAGLVTSALALRRKPGFELRTE